MKIGSDDYYMNKNNYFDDGMLSSAIRMAQNIQAIKQAYVPIIPPEALRTYKMILDVLPPNYNELIVQTQRTAKFYDALKFNNIRHIYDESFLNTYYKIINATKPLIQTIEWTNKYIENNLLVKSLNSLNLTKAQLSIDLEQINCNEIINFIDRSNLLDVDNYENEFKNNNRVNHIVEEFKQEVMEKDYEISAGIEYLITEVKKLDKKTDDIYGKVSKSDILKNIIISLLTGLITGLITGYIFWELPQNSKSESVNNSHIESNSIDKVNFINQNN